MFTVFIFLVVISLCNTHQNALNFFVIKQHPPESLLSNYFLSIHSIRFESINLNYLNLKFAFFQGILFNLIWIFSSMQNRLTSIFFLLLSISIYISHIFEQFKSFVFVSTYAKSCSSFFFKLSYFQNELIWFNVSFFSFGKFNSFLLYIQFFLLFSSKILFNFHFFRDFF